MGFTVREGSEKVILVLLGLSVPPNEFLCVRTIVTPVLLGPDVEVHVFSCPSRRLSRFGEDSRRPRTSISVAGSTKIPWQVEALPFY